MKPDWPILNTILLLMVGLLTGVLLGVSWGHRALSAQWTLRLREAEVRVLVDERAIELLAKDKFDAAWRKRQAVKEMNQ